MGLPSDALQVFIAHAGSASVRDLAAIDGVTTAMVHGWRRRGITVKVHRGVDRIAGAPVTNDQKLWAALLRCGEHAVAGPRASCWLHGLEGFSTLEIDVVVKAPHRCRGTAFPALTRTLRPQDVTFVRGVPTLSASRAIIEIAHTLSDKQLRVLIDSARRKRLVTIERLRDDAIALRDEDGCRRGARAALELLGSGSLDMESENEREVEEFLATTTLELEWQVEGVVPGRRLDALDRAAGLVLEIDSQLWHTLGSDRDSDGLRDLEISEAGDYVVFHLTLGMVRFTPEETRRRLDAIRARRISRRAAP
jgi:hypothetical protein